MLLRLAKGLLRDLIGTDQIVDGAAVRSRPKASVSAWGVRAALGLLVTAMAPAAVHEDATSRFLGRAEKVFVGRVIRAESQTTPDGRLILTHYRFATQEGLSGGSTVELVEYGGSVGDTTLTLSHGVDYRLGSIYLVFAGRDEVGRWRTINGSQGRLLVIVDKSGRKLVRVFPGHPLAALLGGEPAIFHDLGEIKSRLKALGAGASR